MNAPATALDRLDWARYELVAQRTPAGRILRVINAALGEARAALEPERWAAFVQQCRQHPVAALLLEDPLTRRSFAKPRGYPGDAGLLDIIYSRDWREDGSGQPTPRGLELFRHTIECQAPAAVRHRRELLAGLIDEVAQARPAAHLMSVACGHLRELELSAAMRERRIGRFVGLDQDRSSLEVVRRAWPDHGVETVAGSVKALWSVPLREQRFDFVYTAGLYDYLDDRFAARLTTRLFQLLQPGGRLLVANFHPSVADVGYMETFMDWKLIYRDQAAMEQLAAGLGGAVAGQRIFSDPSGAVLYLQLERRA